MGSCDCWKTLHYIMIDLVHFNQTPASTSTKLEGVADMSSKFITKYFHSMCSLWRFWGHVVFILSMKRTGNNHIIRGNAKWMPESYGNINGVAKMPVSLAINRWMSQQRDWSGVKLIKLTYLGLNQMADIFYTILSNAFSLNFVNLVMPHCFCFDLRMSIINFADSIF